MKLNSRAKDQLPANCTVFGRVFDRQNNPVAGAVVTLNGLTVARSTSFGPPSEGSDVVAVSDSSGEFEL
ncbi:MAG: carboxypeptidase-like regulatory domain-containing protein [Candidatus Omnitrophica bacterium]|nr:carboxypeptidase-like regulatory domain-containing protein [Candidatus Omnitrophota bacterium]